MYVDLICHPDTPTAIIEAIGVEIARSERGLAVEFTIYGDDHRLVLPPTVPECRRSGLWQTTCFEAFVHREGEGGYREYNVSPSSEWAAYSFDGYREGMRDADLPSPPTISLTGYEKVLEVAVLFPLDPSGGALTLGLSVVLEERDGTKSYWALAHPSGDPDFHHPDGFVLRLDSAH